MQTQNRLLDDLARVANGAIGTLGGVKTEIETLIRQRLETLLANMDLVTREEFEAVKAMAARARGEQEALAARLAALEEQAAGKAVAKPAPAKKRTTRKKKTST